MLRETTKQGLTLIVNDDENIEGLQYYRTALNSMDKSVNIFFDAVLDYICDYQDESTVRELYAQMANHLMISFDAICSYHNIEKQTDPLTTIDE